MSDRYACSIPDPDKEVVIITGGEIHEENSLSVQ